MGFPLAGRTRQQSLEGHTKSQGERGIVVRSIAEPFTSAVPLLPSFVVPHIWGVC